MKDKEEEEEAATILRGSYNGLVGCFVRLTEGLTWWSGMGPTKGWNIWVIRSESNVQTGGVVGYGIF